MIICFITIGIVVEHVFPFYLCLALSLARSHLYFGSFLSQLVYIVRIFFPYNFPYFYFTRSIFLFNISSLFKNFMVVSMKKLGNSNVFFSPGTTIQRQLPSQFYKSFIHDQTKGEYWGYFRLYQEDIILFFRRLLSCVEYYYT